MFYNETCESLTPRISAPETPHIRKTRIRQIGNCGGPARSGPKYSIWLLLASSVPGKDAKKSIYPILLQELLYYDRHRLSENIIHY